MTSNNEIPEKSIANDLVKMAWRNSFHGCCPYVWWRQDKPINEYLESYIR
jgi:hypothetical protein